jgi:hypothetical protein
LSANVTRAAHTRDPANCAAQPGQRRCRPDKQRQITCRPQTRTSAADLAGVGVAERPRPTAAAANFSCQIIGGGGPILDRPPRPGGRGPAGAQSDASQLNFAGDRPEKPRHRVGWDRTLPDGRRHSSRPVRKLGENHPLRAPIACNHRQDFGKGRSRKRCQRQRIRRQCLNGSGRLWTNYSTPPRSLPHTANSNSVSTRRSDRSRARSSRQRRRRCSAQIALGAGAAC